MGDIEGFFDAAGEDYRARYNRMSEVHRRAAEIISSAARGRTVCVGGMWPGATPTSAPRDLAIVDISRRMLALWRDYDAELVRADARAMPFADGSIETLVFPMILHHICDGTTRGARRGVRDVFREARRVLAPGGQAIIVDYTVPAPVYAVERVLAPATRAALSIRGIPLVVMHTAGFYAAALAAAGFMSSERIETGEDRGRLEVIQPVIGLPWLRVPRFLYPVRPLFMIARA